MIPRPTKKSLYSSSSPSQSSSSSPSPSPFDTTDRSEIRRRAKNYAIYPIIRHHAVSYIGGSEDSGKQMLFAQILYKWLHEPYTFGFPNYPSEFAILCLLQSESEFRRTAARVGLLDEELTVYAPGNAKGAPFPELCDALLKKKPDAKVIWLDCIHQLLPPATNVISYGPVSRLMADVRNVLRERKLTLITGGANAKPKAHHERPIDAFLGSNGWTENHSCFIGLERPIILDGRGRPPRIDDESTSRKLTILSQDAPYYSRWLEVSATGLLVENSAESNREQQVQNNMDGLMSLLESFPEDYTFTANDILEQAEMINISRATCYRYVAMLKDDGRLQAAGYGKYQIRREQ